MQETWKSGNTLNLDKIIKIIGIITFSVPFRKQFSYFCHKMRAFIVISDKDAGR